ncbi:unnamed protein product [Rotaria sordida]|uniref:Rieske domain-containing protein n=1 Tax=Rotaria sordida TaxID=392033 RepID=A0A813RT07_9BILA|nr:unnamed protein product [Rotaria sordida]CAF0836860.1 unnamed protein product [Rotaria sordida]
MNTFLKLNILTNLYHQRCYLSTSSILHSWFVKLTNVTQVNTEAGIPKHTRKRNYPLTYEQRQFPKLIGHTKTWNTFNTSNLRDGKRKAEIVSDDLFLRQFIYGTWHSLFASELIIKRRHNMIILSGLVTRTIHPRRMYFLIGYTEEILSALLKTPVKMEIQTIDNMAMQMCNRRVTQATTKLVRQLAKSVPMKVEDNHHDDEYTRIPVPKTSTVKTMVSMYRYLLHDNASVTTGLNTALSIRHAHTDIQIPNFDYYRHADDNTVPYSYLTPIGMAITSAYMAKYMIRDIAAFVGPAKDVTSLAKVEINLDTVLKAKMLQLRHPQNDSERVQKPEWVIVIGICAHLGCMPIANARDFGGYFCPCHGSHYDASERIRKGPAPFNLEIPQYVFKDDSTVVIG